MSGQRFQVGDMVESITDSRGLLPLGSLRQVAAVRATPTMQCRNLDGSPKHPAGQCCGIHIVDGPNPESGRYWNGCSWRLVYRPDPTLIERLTAEPVLADAPVKRETAEPDLHTTQTSDGRGVLRFRGWNVGVFPTPEAAEQMRRAVNLHALADLAERSLQPRSEA